MALSYHETISFIWHFFDNKPIENNIMTMQDYSAADIARPKYVKVTYMGLDNKLHEIKTDVKFIGDMLISVYFRYNKDFNINYPQKVSVKFITEDGLYVAETTLQKIEKSGSFVYFDIGTILSLLPFPSTKINSF